MDVIVCDCVSFLSMDDHEHIGIDVGLKTTRRDISAVIAYVSGSVSKQIFVRKTHWIATGHRLIIVLPHKQT